MTKHALNVGQELWYVPGDCPKNARSVTVTAVGRKWAHLSTDERLNIETMHVEHWDHTKCFLSQEDYMQQVATYNAWRNLRDAISRRPRPDCVGVDAIRQAASLLGLADCLKDIDQ